jgi:hypothetical protein
MFVIRNNGLARDFRPNSRPFFMGRNQISFSDDAEFAEAMNEYPAVVAKIKEDIDSLPIGKLRHLASQYSISLERGDKAGNIRAKIRAASSLI